MYSIATIANRFAGKISFTMSLVVVESLLDILFPLFIGWAVNDLMNNSYDGLILLAGLGVASLLTGAARRYFDTRIYGGIYCEITGEMVVQGRQTGLSVSKLSARSDLLTEMVEFFEHSVPGIAMSLIGVVGTLAIIASLNIYIFCACLALLLLMTLVYVLTGNTQYRYHEQYNHILENQVDVLTHKTKWGVRAHFMNLMRWNIRLSDMETFNFSIIWLGAIALFVVTPILAIQASTVTPQAGTVLSLLIYAFDFSEKVITLPLYVQQLIRLKEISNRLNGEATLQIHSSER